MTLQRRKSFWIVTVGLLLVTGIGLVIGVVSRDSSDKRPEKGSPTTTTAGTTPRVDREALLAELAKKRGGLPIDQALRQASTPQARAFLERDLAYQRQTRAQAADEARRKLAEVEGRLEKGVGKPEQSSLERQREMLRNLIAQLSR